MISFACKNIDMRDIVMCSFDLSRTEYHLLLFLLSQDGPLPVTTVADRLDLERSTVQKGISSLLAKSLVERRQRNLSGGGYRFVYEVVEKEQVKVRLQSIVDGWHRNVSEAISSW